MKMLKRVGIVLGVLCVATILVVGIVLSIPPKMLDFSGEVTEITMKEDVYVIRIVEGSVASYVVTADARSQVYREGDPKQPLSLEDIQVGDTIEGNYRLFTDENEAKYIRVRE